MNHPREPIDLRTARDDDVHMTTHEQLQQAMDFDHVIQVHADGTITDANGIYAPELVDDDLSGEGWTLMSGYTGQQSYCGPVMHASEYIGGRLADDILAAPGYYVAILACYTDDTDGVVDDIEPEGWAVAFKPAE